jgi:hypothetical protein
LISGLKQTMLTQVTVLIILSSISSITSFHRSNPAKLTVKLQFQNDEVFKVITPNEIDSLFDPTDNFEIESNRTAFNESDDTFDESILLDAAGTGAIEQSPSQQPSSRESESKPLNLQDITEEYFGDINLNEDLSKDYDSYQSVLKYISVADSGDNRRRGKQKLRVFQYQPDVERYRTVNPMQYGIYRRMLDEKQENDRNDEMKKTRKDYDNFSSDEQQMEQDQLIAAEERAFALFLKRNAAGSVGQEEDNFSKFLSDAEDSRRNQRKQTASDDEANSEETDDDYYNNGGGTAVGFAEPDSNEDGEENDNDGENDMGRDFNDDEDAEDIDINKP